MLLRPLIALAALLALSACSHGSEETVTFDPEPPGEFARRALGAIDAADSCADLTVAWDEYLDAATRASVAHLVPCTRRLLATRYVVLDVRPYEADYAEFPEGVPGAGVHRVLLEPIVRGDVDAFPLSDLLDDGWFVVTRDCHSSLLNPGIVALDECLATKDECSMAG